MMKTPVSSFSSESMWGSILDTISNVSTAQTNHSFNLNSPMFAIARKVLTSSSEAESTKYADKLNQYLGEDLAFQVMDDAINMHHVFQLKQNEELFRSSFVDNHDNTAVVLASTSVLRLNDVALPDIVHMGQSITRTQSCFDSGYVSVKIRKELSNASVLVPTVLSQNSMNMVQSVNASPEPIPSDIVTTVESVRIVERRPRGRKKRARYVQNEEEGSENQSSKKYAVGSPIRSLSSTSAPVSPLRNRATLHGFISPKALLRCPLGPIHATQVDRDTNSLRETVTAAIYSFFKKESVVDLVADPAAQQLVEIVLKVESKQAPFSISNAIGSLSTNKVSCIEYCEQNDSDDSMSVPIETKSAVYSNTHIVGVQVIVPSQEQKIPKLWIELVL